MLSLLVCFSFSYLSYSNESANLILKSLEQLYTLAPFKFTTIMSASNNQSSLNEARGAGTTFGPNDTTDSSKATPGYSVGSATAMGHGDHPNDHADDSNATLPNSRIGPQKEDLDGEQMAAPGEGDVMQAQFDKKNAGWGEQDSMTGDLDRMKAEQKGAREEVKDARKQGQGVDGGAGNRLANEGLNSV